jgi:cobalt/nickel transport protein
VADGPLAGYAVRGIDDPALSTGLAGIVGVTATFVIATGGFALVRRLGSRRSATGPAAGPLT